MRHALQVTIRSLFRAVLAVVLLLGAGAGTAGAQASGPGLSLAEAREGIVAATKRWDAARLAVDTAALTHALLPEFYAVMNPFDADARLSRDAFLAQVLALPAGKRLARFETTILTLIRTPKGFEAVVQEKLEFVGAPTGGAEVREYALWVTRDGWRQVDGEWKATHSIAVGAQGWRAPARPPFADW